MFSRVYVVDPEIPGLIYTARTTSSPDQEFQKGLKKALLAKNLSPKIEAKKVAELASGGPCCLGPVFVCVNPESFVDGAHEATVRDFFHWWRALNVNCRVLAAALYYHDYWIKPRVDVEWTPKWEQYRDKSSWISSTVFVVASKVDDQIPDGAREKFANAGARFVAWDVMSSEVSCLTEHLGAEGQQQHDVVVVNLGPTILEKWEDWLQTCLPFGKRAAVFARPVKAPSATWGDRVAKVLPSWLSGSREDTNARLLVLVLEIPAAAELPETVSLENSVRKLLQQEVGGGRPFVLCLRTEEGKELKLEEVKGELDEWLAQKVLGYPETQSFEFEALVEQPPALDVQTGYFVARKQIAPIIIEPTRNRLRPGSAGPEARA